MGSELYIRAEGFQRIANDDHVFKSEDSAPLFYVAVEQV